MRQEIVEGLPKRDQRRDVELPAILYRNDNSKLAVVISNLSYDGCHVRSANTFEVGEDFTLVFPKLGEIMARVQWTGPSGVGVRFLPEDSAGDHSADQAEALASEASNPTPSVSEAPGFSANT